MASTPSAVCRRARRSSRPSSRATAAQLAREHNHANVLCIGARLNTPEQAAAVIREELARYAKIIKTGGIVYKP